MHLYIDKLRLKSLFNKNLGAIDVRCTVHFEI